MLGFIRLKFSITFSINTYLEKVTLYSFFQTLFLFLDFETTTKYFTKEYNNVLYSAKMVN